MVDAETAGPTHLTYWCAGRSARRGGNPHPGRLAARRLELDVTAAARAWLALSGFDPLYGARPLRRLVQSAIEDQLARRLLAGRSATGTPCGSTSTLRPIG